MPRFYRAMYADGNKPQIGPNKKSLGVQAGADRYDDIAPDEDDNVHPGTGGMSVAPHWTELPAYRIPRRLKSKCAKATGNNNYVCWRMGDGEFESGDCTEDLVLFVDSDVHGTVQPSETMSLSAYQKALAATQSQWVRDED